MTERELVGTALDHLSSLWPDATLSFGLENDKADYGSDGRVTLEVEGSIYRFDFEAKRQVTIATAVRIEERLAPTQLRRFLLITEQIRPAVAKALQERRISYADAAGNCHIDRPPLFLHVEGKKMQRSSSTEPVRAFKGEGLKVIFVLLLQADLVSRSYRELATLSGASHGVVQYTINDLDRLGFVVRLSRSRRHIDRLPELLDRWATAYIEALRPKHRMGVYRFTDAARRRAWASLPLDSDLARLSGEAAYASATHNLQPARLIVYSREAQPEVMKRFQVVPDERGSLEVIHTFWPRTLEDILQGSFSDPCVPDVLVYADLIATRDPRNAEAAAHLRAQWLEAWEDG